jgi:multicopper oxidase
MYHCHVQTHSDMGMAGLFLVSKADGTIPGYDPGHDHPMSGKQSQREGTAQSMKGMDGMQDMAGMHH